MLVFVKGRDKENLKEVSSGRFLKKFPLKPPLSQLILNPGTSKWTTWQDSFNQDGGVFVQLVTAPKRNNCQVCPRLCIYDSALVPDREI